MVIVGFSDKTSWQIIRLMCGHFKHCVVISEHKGKLVLHQFVHRNNVAHIAITRRGINQLKNNGWIFISLNRKPEKFNEKKWTCVSYVKYALGIKKFWIQTPNSLYRFLKKNLT